MTYAITDLFNSPIGEWDTVGPWDGTEASDSAKAFIGTQSHVDLRCFLDIANTIAVPQTELEAPVQQTTLDGEAQSAMETRLGLNQLDEAWVLSTTTGTNDDLVVGIDAYLDGWSDAQFTLDGSALACNLDSIITDEIDISAMDALSVVFPNHTTFDSTSYVQLTSGTDFTGTGASAHALFSANTSSLPEVRLDLADFTTSGFDPTKVTGIRIHLVEASPTPSAVVRVVAVRAVATAWTESFLDINTRLQAVVVPPTLDGNAYGGTVAQAFQFVRGDGTKLDPIPSDTVISLFFAPGGQDGINLATGGLKNTLAVILREIKDTDAGTGSHIEALLTFTDSSTDFKAQRVDTTGGSPGTPTTHGVYTENIGGALDSSKRYQFIVTIRGTLIDATLNETDVNNKVLDLVWHLSTTLSDSAYTYRNGRVGFISDFITRDAYVDDILVSPTGFASLTTEVFESRTPVDGAQLTAVSAGDMNLWNGFDGPDLFFDNTKTTSGDGSFRTQISLQSNTFIVDDWTQSYLDLDIWVPSNVTRANQPIIQINTDSGPENVVVPNLQPAQWNHLHFDMGLFRNFLTGTGYSFSILAASNPDKALGNFWVDSVVFGRRRVAWSMRAQDNGVFRQFGFMLNNPIGAVHLPTEERGQSLQLRAEALTDDAWVSSFKVFPRYAELGRQRFVDRGGGGD